jgi:protein-L-isoaspartate(D-aspartate) O-methyltransferase
MFARREHDSARDEMLAHLSEHGIRSPRVLEAMARVPRERFVPADVRHLAFADRALPIECDQTISQPYIVALMTEALALTGHERVLEIGTGSGYQAAVLAELAAEVVSVERHEPLSQAARAVLDELGYRNVQLIVGDGTQGWPPGAPYDRILVAAAATQVPAPLVEQLAEGGTLIIPVGPSHSQTLYAYHKRGGHLQAEPLSGCRFVPLVGAQHPRHGAGSESNGDPSDGSTDNGDEEPDDETAADPNDDGS